MAATIIYLGILSFWVVRFFITLSVFAYFIEKLDNVVLQVGILMIVIFAEIA